MRQDSKYQNLDRGSGIEPGDVLDVILKDVSKAVSDKGNEYDRLNCVRTDNGKDMFLVMRNEVRICLTEGGFWADQTETQIKPDVKATLVCYAIENRWQRWLVFPYQQIPRQTAPDNPTQTAQTNTKEQTNAPTDN